MVNFKSYLHLLRLRDAWGYFLLALFGFLLAQGFLFSLKDIVIFWAIIFLGAGFGFSINDCFDQREDHLDKTKKNPIVLKEIGFSRALTFSLILAFFGLFFSSLYGRAVFLLCLASILLTLFYSSPPLRLKSKPPFDLISHGFFGGVLIFFFPLLFFKTQLNSFYYLIALSAFCFSVLLEMRNEYEDYESDKIAGLKTTAHILGYQRTEKLLKFLASFYPLFLLPIFYLIFPIKPILAFLFLIFTFIFFALSLTFKKHLLVRNYKLLDGYNILSYCLILIAVL
jgi:4-hydroxybenzoate polyprenyltransferase